VEGRRALLAATATDLEPIVLAHDPQPTVTELTDVARQGPTTLELRDTDGVEHRLWRVTEPSLLARLADAWGETNSVIADSPRPEPMRSPSPGYRAATPCWHW
jgi:uncharacterized protein (DUF1015 family)